MRIRWIVLLLLLLAGALLALQDPLRLGGTSDVGRHDEPPPDVPPLRREDAADTTHRPGDAEPSLAGARAGDGERTATAPAETEPTTGAADDAVEAVATYEGAVPPGWHEAPPARRRHAIRPPRPRGPVVGAGGSRGGMGPTGHGSRFPPPGPPKGDATLRVQVTSPSGARVAGADVYLGPPESLHAQSVSFGDLRKLGTTGTDGTLTAPDLPAGAGVVAANLANRLNGPRGLDASTSIPVLLVSRATVDARVALPFDADAFGAVEGRVVDAKGDGVARAEVRTGFLRTYADADGRFRLPRVPAGAQALSARRNGYATETVTVDVPRGGTREVSVTLAWAEQGDLRLGGRVLTATGAGLEGATVHLIDEQGRGTLRTVRTGPDGAYAFEALPERLTTTTLRVQAGKHRDGYGAANVRLEAGLVEGPLDITLPPQQVRVRFHLRDAGTGDPVDRCRVEGVRLDVERSTTRGFTGRRPNGIYEHFHPAGRYRFEVEAPDRETQVVEADLTPPGGTVDLEVTFPTPASVSVPVTVRVRVVDAVTKAAVTACSIQLLDAQGVEVARFVGGDPEGRYSLPGTSAARTVRVNAAGYETLEDAVEPEPPETELVTWLEPR